MSKMTRSTIKLVRKKPPKNYFFLSLVKLSRNNFHPSQKMKIIIESFNLERPNHISVYVCQVVFVYKILIPGNLDTMFCP